MNDRAILATSAALRERSIDVVRFNFPYTEKGSRRPAPMLAADGFACDGLRLFAYPLHPAGQPEKLRDAHLPRINVPVLCFNGTRDALCRRDLMERALTTVKAPWRMHWLEGADHSLKGDKLLNEIGEAVTGWLAGVQADA